MRHLHEEHEGKISKIGEFVKKRTPTLLHKVA